MTNGDINLEGNFTIATDGTFDPVNNSHDIAGNWDDVDGTFQATDGTITISGSGPSTIKTGINNKFNNLTIDGTIETFSDNDIEIGGVLDVNDTKTLTVVAGDQLTFTGNTSAHTIVGTLTMNTTSGNNSTIDFTGSTSNTVVVDGTLNLNGTDATGQALVTGAADPALVDLEFPDGASGTGSGKFNGNFFTISFPVADGVKIANATEPTMDNGTFQNPTAGGILLNLNNASVLPSVLSNLTFNGTPGVDINVSADGDTDPVTFVDFLGTLASTATVAEDNDSDNSGAEDKLTWFNGVWYSNGNNDPRSEERRVGKECRSRWSPYR